MFGSQTYAAHILLTSAWLNYPSIDEDSGEIMPENIAKFGNQNSHNNTYVNDNYVFIVNIIRISFLFH